MNIKKNTIKKDQKKDILAKKKNDEIAALQKRQKDILLRKKNPKNVDLQTLKLWVQEYAVACVDEKEILEAQTEEIQTKDECELEIQSLNSVYSEKMLQIERNELLLSENDPSIDQDELFSLTSILKQENSEILDRIEILEDKIKRKTELIINYSNALANSRIEDIKSRALLVSSLEDCQNLISVLFDEILGKAFEFKKLEKKMVEKTAENENNKILFFQSENEIKKIIKNYENELNKLKKEVKYKEFRMTENLNTLPDTSFNFSKTLELKDLEHSFKESKSARSLVESKIEDKNKQKTVFTNLKEARDQKKHKIVEDPDKKLQKSPISRNSTLRSLNEEEFTPKLERKSYSEFKSQKLLQK